jgi:gliding motility-associated-like protein
MKKLFQNLHLLTLVFAFVSMQASGQTTGCQISLGVLTPNVCVGNTVCIPFTISPAGCIPTNNIILELAGPLATPNSSCSFVNIRLDTVGNCLRVPDNFPKGKYCVRLRRGTLVSDVKSFEIDTIDNSPAPVVRIVQLPPIRPSYCKGDTVKFRIDTILNAGVGYALQWSRNDTARDGDTSAVFTVTNLTDGDYVSASVTRQNKCALNATGRSDSLAVSVNKPPVVTVELQPGFSGCEKTVNGFVAKLQLAGPDPLVIWTRSSKGRVDTLSQGINDTLFTLSPADSALFGDSICARVVSGRCKLTDRDCFVIRACGEVVLDLPLDTAACAGSLYNVPYNLIGSFLPSNVFTVQLSDSAGNFSSPVQIGSLTSDRPDTIQALLPPELKGGDCYRVRIVSSAPADTSDTSACFRVFPRPLKPVTVSDSVCVSGEVTLSASSTEPGVQFNWYPNPFSTTPIFTGPTRTFTVQGDSVYYISALSPRGCESDRTEVRAVSNAADPVEIGANQAFCQGAQTFSLNPSIGGGVWSGDLPVINNQVDLTGVAAGAYTLIYQTTNALGCIATDSLEVSVKPIPVPNAGTDFNVCSNGNVLQLSGLPAGGVWIGSSILSDGTFNPAQVTGPQVSLIYSFTDNGCTGFDTVLANINPAPGEFSVTGVNPSSCTTDDGSATVTGITLQSGWKARWSVNRPDSTAFPTLSGLGGGTYEVIIKDTVNGCFRKESVSLSDPEVPAPVIAGLLSAYCTNDSCVALSITPNVPSGSWSGPGLEVLPDGNARFCPQNSGQGALTISYQYDGESGCVGASSVSVQVNPSPNVNAGFFADTLCSDAAPFQLTGFSPSAPPAVWGPQPAVSANGLFNPALAVAGTNELTLTITANGCTSTSTRTMVVAPKPSPLISRSPSNTVCAGESVTLTVDPGTGVIPRRIEWFRNSQVIPNQNGLTISVSQPGSYTASITGAGLCSATSSAIDVQFNALPPDSVSVSGDLNPCSSNLPTFTAQAGNGFTYQWFSGLDSLGGASNAVFSPSASGQFRVRIRDASGCTSFSDFIQVNVRQAPEANVIAPLADTCLQSGQEISIQLAATGAGLTFQWFRLGTPPVLIAGQNSATLTGISQPGRYFAVASSTNGCETNSDTVNILSTVAITVQDSIIFKCVGEPPFTIGGFSPGGCPLIYNGTVLTNNIWNPTEPGDFEVTYQCTNSNGCISRKNILVRVSPVPLANLVVLGPTNLCQGDSVLLQVNNGVESGSSYQLYRNGQPFGLPFLQPQIRVSQSGNYQVEVKFNRCTALSNTLNINFRKIPLAKAGPDLSECGFLVTNLNAASGITPGEWSGSTRVTTSGDYNSDGFTGCETLTLTVDSNGCSAKDTRVICLKANPVQLATATDASNCSVTDGKAWVVNATSGMTFSWKKSGSAAVVSTTDSLLNVGPGVYTVNISTDSNNCSIERSVVIGSPNNLNVDINGLPDSVCFGSEPIQLAGIPADSGIFTSFANRIVDGTVFDPSIPGPLTDTVYYSASLNGCLGTIKKVIKLNPLPVVDAGPDSRVCFGDTIVLEAVQPSGVPLVWIGPQVEGNNLFIANNSSLSSALVTVSYTRNGCTNSDTRLIGIDTLPQFNVVPSDVSSCGICDGSAIREISNSNQFQTIWREVPGGNIIATGASLNNRCVGVYAVQVIRNSTGCSRTETFGISGPTNINPFACLENVPSGICQNGAPVAIGKCNQDAKIFIGGVETDTLNPAALPPGNAQIILTLTDSNGCTGVQQISVPVRPNPVVNIAGSTPDFACTSQSSLQLSGFFPAYDASIPENGWSAAGAPAGFITKGGLVNPSLVNADSEFTLNYTVKNPGPEGCTVTKSIPFRVYKNPVAAIIPSAGPIEICAGTQTQLSADPVVPGFTYTWLLGGTNPLPIGFEPQFNASLAGLYSLQVSNNGCKSQNLSAVQVNVTPAPIIASIGADTTVCKSAGIVNLPFPTIVGTASFAQWQAVSPTPADFISTTGSVNPAVVDQGAFQVRFVAGQGTCVDTALRTITVLPTKVTTIAGADNAEVCEGQNLVLVADSTGPGIGYIWYKDGIAIPNSNNDSLLVNASGQYRVKLTINGNGSCSPISVDAVSVLVKPSPVVSINGNLLQKICFPGSPYNVGDANPFSPLDAIWSSSVPGLITVNGLVRPDSLQAEGTFDLILSKTVGGCSASDTLKLTAFRTPDAIFGASALAICDGDQILLSYENPNGYSTTWSKDGSVIAVNVDSVGITTAGTYKLRVENDICSAESSASYEVKPKPVFNLPPDTLICKNGQAVQFFPINPGPGTGGWSGPGINANGNWDPTSADVPASGDIDISYTLSSEGCSTTKSFRIEVGAVPDVSLAASKDTAEILEPVTITAGGGVTFEWSPSDTTINPKFGPVVIAKIPSSNLNPDFVTKKYTVMVSSAKGCKAEKSIDIIIDQRDLIYTGFSPNGDQKNDVWVIKNIQKYPEASVRIYNRWGNLVFESKKGYPEPWNGTYNAGNINPDGMKDGDPVPAGSYYYHIELGPGRVPKSGSVTLVR